MIIYATSLKDITPEKLRGFFVGWPKPPSAETHLKLLHGSSHVILAIDSKTGRVVGFINAVSDGFLSAYLPLLEVLPKYQKQGVGGELVKRMMAMLDSFYMIDLATDDELCSFYERFGLSRITAMGRRNFDRQNGE